MCGHASLKTAQAMGMLVPPLYLIGSIVRGRGVSIHRLMRVTTIWVAGGAVLGVAAGYARLRDQPPEALEDRVYRLAGPFPILWAGMDR